MAHRTAKQRLYSPPGLLSAVLVASLLLLLLQWLENAYLDINLEQSDQDTTDKLQLALDSDAASLMLVMEDFRGVVTYSAEDRQLIDFMRGKLVDKEMMTYRFSRGIKYFPYIRNIKLVDLNGIERLRMARDEKYDLVVLDNNSQQDISYKEYVVFAETLKPNQVGLYRTPEDHQGTQWKKHSVRFIAPVHIDGALLGYIFYRINLGEIIAWGLRHHRVSNHSFQYFLHDKDAALIYDETDDEKLLEGFPGDDIPLSAADFDSYLWPKMSQNASIELLTFNQHLYRYAWLDFPNFINYRGDSSGLFMLARAGRGLTGYQAADVERLSGVLWVARLIALLLSGPIVWSIFVWKEYRQMLGLSAAAMKSTSPILVLDRAGKVIEVNQSYCQRRNMSRENLLDSKTGLFEGEEGKKRLHLVNTEGEWVGEYESPYTGDGYTEMLSVKPIEGSSYFACNFVDINDQKKIQKELERLSLTDPMTELPNRRAFDIQAYRLIGQHQRHPERSFCFLILDIDHFKLVNDQYGHDIGDQVLVSFAKALVPKLRTTDYLARLGGEEFGVFLADTNSADGIVVADRIRGWIAEAKSPVAITCSIGLAQYRQGLEWSQLYKCADQALYQAKENGRNRVEVSALPAE